MKNEAEISNPSDKAFCCIDDWEAACLAVNMVGNGKYGLHSRQDGGKDMPIFIFGGTDNWWKKEFGMDRFKHLEEVGSYRIAQALKSFRLDGERTSMNDFTEYAHQLAKSLEAPNEKP